MRDLKDRCKVAVVQAAPVMFDKKASVDCLQRWKLCNRSLWS
ncbi:Uncharacterised protein [Chlamydia trachomatis]|nr:Uncharacterised protein [Chlamydia trachomatis]